MRRPVLILVFALACGVAAAAAEAQQGGSAIRGRVTDEQKGVLPGSSIRRHAPGDRHHPRDNDGTGRLVPGAGSRARAVQDLRTAPRVPPADSGGHRPENRGDHPGRLRAPGRRRRRKSDRHRRIAAGRPHVRASRRHHHFRRSGESPFGVAQFHQHGRTAAGSDLQRRGRFLIRQRDDQRAERQRRRLSAGWREQQRRLARRELRRTGAAAARRHSGIPGRDESVRRGVRRRDGRRGERRDQAGHEYVARKRVRVLHRRLDDREGPPGRAAECREARSDEETVGRHLRRSDPSRQDALFRELRAAGPKRRPQPRPIRRGRIAASPWRRKPTRGTTWAVSISSSTPTTPTTSGSCGITSRTTTRFSATAPSTRSASRRTTTGRSRRRTTG